MSKSKIALLVLIVATTSAIAYFSAQQLLGGKSMKPVPVEKIKAIQTDITPPDPAIFNDKAINPTVTITIGENDQNPIGQ